MKWKSLLCTHILAFGIMAFDFSDYCCILAFANYPFLSPKKHADLFGLYDSIRLDATISTEYGLHPVE